MGAPHISPSACHSAFAHQGLITNGLDATSLLYDKTFPGKTKHTGLLIPDRESMTDQSMDTSKVQVGKPVSFIGVAYRIVCQGYLPKQKCLKESCISKALTKLGTWSLLHTVQAPPQVGVSFPN